MTDRIALAALVLIAAAPQRAFAQTPPDAPQPVPSPSASPSPAPSVLGPALGTNDPCTTLPAFVGRPTVTNSVCTVRPNHVLIESGYQNIAADAGGTTVTYPQALIRIGTAIPALELDVTPPQAQRMSGATAATTDIAAGLKYILGYSEKFSYGLQASFTAPTGTNGASANGTTAYYAFNAAYTLSPALSAATTLADSALTDGSQRWSSFVPSVTLTLSLPGSSGVFAEIAQFTHASGPDTPTRTQYLLGAYHDLGARMQLDVSAARSPTAATGRYALTSFGVSYYF